MNRRGLAARWGRASRTGCRRLPRAQRLPRSDSVRYTYSYMDPRSAALGSIAPELKAVNTTFNE